MNQKVYDVVIRIRKQNKKKKNYCMLFEEKIDSNQANGLKYLNIHLKLSEFNLIVELPKISLNYKINKTN